MINALTGEALARILVTALSVERQLAGSTVSDNQGRWKLATVACGRLTLHPSRPGFYAHPDAMRRLGLLLTPNSAPQEVQLQLTPLGIVTGRVVDDQDDPVPNTQIYPLATTVIQGRRTFTTGTPVTTNDLGEYRLPGLLPGKYIICARANGSFLPVAGGASVTHGESCYPGPIEAGVSIAMELPPGRESKVDFSLKPTSVFHVRRMISGLPAGKGVGVMLNKPGAPPGFTTSKSASARPDGRFDISRVEPGPYLLTAGLWQGPEHLVASLPLTVPSSDLDGVAVNLEPAITLAGAARVESRTPPAGGLKGFRVIPRASMPWPPGTFSLADDRGFAIADVTPGTYRFDFVEPAPFYIASAALGGADVLRGDVSLTTAPGRMEIVLRDDTGVIEGDTADAHGQPIPCWVILLKDGIWLRNSLVPPNGHFKLGNVGPGDYRLYAWDDTAEVDYADAEWMSRHVGARAAVSSGQTTRVKLIAETLGR